MIRPITRMRVRSVSSMHQNRTATNMLRMQYPVHNYRMYGNSRNALARRQSHRQFSDCAFGEPAYQNLFGQPLENMYEIDSMFPESAEKVLSSHRLVNDMRLVYMGYSLVTNQSTTEYQHPVAFITLTQDMTSRQKESLIHELLYLCGNSNNCPSKIFIVNWLPSSGEGKQVDQLMMSE